ncbi:MAG: hypothetical protein ACI4XL_11755 [Bacillus sp. (in: firmicutes)]
MSPYFELVEAVTEKMYQDDPSLMERYGERGKDKCREDNHHHLNHLQTAYELQDIKIFTDYAIWLDGILQKFGMDTYLLIGNFRMLHSLIDRYGNMDTNKRNTFKTYLNKGIEHLIAKEGG